MNYDSKIGPPEVDQSGTTYAPFGADDGEEQRSDRRMWIIGGITVLVLVALWFLARGDGTEQIAATDSAQAPIVTVVTPGRGTIAGRIEATGTLAARRDMPVGSVGEGGQVSRVLVDAGDWVGSGQVLAVIDRSVQTQQQAGLAAQIQVAQADARLAQSNLDRALQLVDRGFISKADVDRLTATRDAASARVKVAQAQLSETRARTQRLNIVAPAAGLVLERNVEPGQVVSAGSGVLFNIARGGEMEMIADLSEDDLAQMSTGISAQVSPVGSQETFTGQVWQVSPVIDPDTRQGTVRIALPYSRELRPGGFATAVIASGTVVAPRLPESAVLADDRGSYVFLVDNDNKIVRRDIRTGAITDEGIAIAQGLSGSERVVLRAGAFLAPGETVEAKVAKLP